MDYDDFCKIINDLKNELDTYEIGSEDYKNVSKFLLLYEKQFEEFKEHERAMLHNDDLLELDKIKVANEKEISEAKNLVAEKDSKRKFTNNIMYIGGILVLGGFCTIWSSENIINNKFAQTLMNFLKPKV